MPRKSDACVHCNGPLSLYEGLNEAKRGRVECATCGCSFLFGDLATRGRDCVEGLAGPERVSAIVARNLREPAEDAPAEDESAESEATDSPTVASE